MAKIESKATATVGVSAQDVWRILANEFLEISHWAGGVRTSVINPKTPEGFNGSVVGGRICDIEGLGLTDERIVIFDPQQHSIGYSIRAEGLPSFVASMTSTWTVVADGDEQAQVGMRIEATTSGIMGAIGSIPMRRMLGKSSAGLLNDLKSYAEKTAG